MSEQITPAIVDVVQTVLDKINSVRLASVSRQRLFFFFFSFITNFSPRLVPPFTTHSPAGTWQPRHAQDFRLVLTLPGGKFRALDNSVSSQELLWPSIEKVSLKLEIETNSKSKAILKKPKSKPKRKGKKKEIALQNPDAWYIEGRGQIEVEHLVLNGGHGDFLVCKRYVLVRCFLNIF